MSNSLWPHRPQHTRFPCPSPTPRACSNSCPSSQWCHPTISSSVVPFFSCLQYFPASESFPASHFFLSGGQSIGVSALAEYSALISFRINWFDLLAVHKTFNSLLNTLVQKHQFFGTQLSLWSNSHNHTSCLLAQHKSSFSMMACRSLQHSSLLTWNVKDTPLVWHSLYTNYGFPGGSDGEESACSVGDPALIPRLGRSPGEGHGNPLQYSCLENTHRQRSLVGYSPWGLKESDMTE